MKTVIKPEELTVDDLRSMVRAEVVPIYLYMLFNDTHPDLIAKVNQLIINRWSVSGLIYIKEQAWKVYDPDGSKFKTSLI